MPLRRFLHGAGFISIFGFLAQGMYCVIFYNSFTKSAGADVPVGIAEGIVQISTSKAAVAAIVQITKGLPQQSKGHGVHSTSLLQSFTDMRG